MTASTDEPSGIAVTARGITWAPGPTILDRVDLDVAAGSVCALLGPNGSGKTSLLRCLAGLHRPDHGTVTYGDTDIARTPARDLGLRRAYVSQDHDVELDFTVLDLVLIGRTPHKRRFEADTDHDRQLARACLAQVGLDGFEHRSVPSLSGGERQRAWLARADAQRAPLVLLDEPTNHLDLRHQHELLDRFRRSPATAIVSLHDPQLAATYADHIVILDHGRIVADGPPERALTATALRDVWGVDATVVQDEHALRITVSGALG